MSRVGVALVVLVGLAFAAFGIDDLRMDAPPPMHQRYFERIGGVAPEVEALVLYAFDGQGGLFLGSGLALLALAAGPLRRGDRHAAVAALSIALCGSAGIALYAHRIGAGVGIPLAMLVTGALGAVLCVGRPRALPSPR